MNKTIKKESENEYILEEENKIIEEIIKNKLINNFDLNKEDEDIEEEDDEDDISKKDEITEEILDGKLSFIVPNEEQKSSDKNIEQRKIHKDIIEDLLIELFDYHYNCIIGMKSINPQARILETKYHIEFFFTKLDINYNYFSKYILLILEQKLEELIEYIKNKFYNSKISLKNVLDIKKSLYLVGIDISKIFELPFKNTKSFDISSVLEVLFICDFLNHNDIDIDEQEYEEMINISKLVEKDNFKKYIEECKTYFKKIENGDREEEDVEVEEEKRNGDGEDNFIKIEEYKKHEDNIIYQNNQKETKKIDEEINKNKNQGKTINIDVYDRDIKNINEIFKDKIQINKISKENNEKNHSDKNVNALEKYDSLTVEDLLKYINSSDNIKRKKKKKKKKKKVIKENKNDKKEIEEKDEVIENFKAYIIEFSENLENCKKIKPNISQAFLDKL